MFFDPVRGMMLGLIQVGLADDKLHGLILHHIQLIEIIELF